MILCFVSKPLVCSCYPCNRRQREQSQSEHLKVLGNDALPWQRQTCSSVPEVCFCVLGCVWEDALRAQEPGTLGLAMAAQPSSEPWAALAACLGWRWRWGWHRFREDLSARHSSLIWDTQPRCLTELVETLLPLYFWNHVRHRRESWPL